MGKSLVPNEPTNTDTTNEERQAHLWFLEGMDRITRAMQGADDLEQMMSDALAAVLSIFETDRVWMVYPCDPESRTWRIVMERTRQELSDSLSLGPDFSMDGEVAHVHRIVRASKTAVRLGPGADIPIPSGIAERFGVESQMCLAVYPKIGQPYIFGLNQCTGARNWTAQEQKLFEATGQRLATLLTSLSMSRDLQESKARLEEAQRVAHVGHYYWNLDSNRVTWSDELYRIYGLPPQEGPIDMAMVREMIHPEDREQVFRAVEEAVRNGVHAEAEHRVVRPNGEVRTVRGLGSVKRDASGQAYEMFGTVQDITDRKRAEEVVRRNEFYLSEGQRLAHMGSWASKDLGMRWTDDLGIYWSDEVYKIFGLDPQKGPPTLEQYLAAVHPDDRASMAETIRVMHEQRCGCDVTKRIVQPSGEVRYVRCVGVPIFDDGVFKAFHGMTIDVTEHELLTQELRRERAYLTEAQSLTHIGSWASNLATRQVFHASDENARIFGFDPRQEAMSFDRFYNAILAEDEAALRVKLENAIRTDTDFDVEYRIRRPDGAIRFLRAIGHRNPSGEHGEYLGITMDITERKLAEQERERLRQLEADLAQINRVNMLGELAAALAHELKQPIAASITNASACLRWLAHDPPDLERARAAASSMKQDGNRAADVIDHLRSFYKKGTPAQREITDVKDIVQEMITLLTNEASPYSITIHSEFDSGVPNVLADRVQLQQVFMNLMLNAIEAMKGTGGELTVRSGLSPEGQLLVSIRDTGVGLPAENRERIFDAFHTTKAQGTGMGLAITRSIVEAHGGRIWGADNPGAGATFHFTLPVKAEGHP